MAGSDTPNHHRSETLSAVIHALPLQTPLGVPPLLVKVTLKSLTTAVYATTFAYVKSVCASAVLRLVQVHFSLRKKASSFNWGI